jgi:hypothetical protein
LLTGRSKEFDGLHFDEVAKIMEYRDSQIKVQEKLEKQSRAELHAFAEEHDKTAKEKTQAATKDKSFYSRNQNKRETRAADSKTWGAMSAMTNIPQATVRSTNVTKHPEENVVKFPTMDVKNEQTYANTDDIQSLFSRKSREKRRGDKSDE